ncbi:MAG: hypothetical protein KAF27_07225 [Porphyrobacter sp.]|nr:hypothetical protein [Porphyrobacter sp.]
MNRFSLAAAFLLLGASHVAHAEAAPVSVRLNKVVLDTENAGTTGFVKGGTMCVSSDRFTWYGFSNRDVIQEAYQWRFARAMAGTKFKVLDASKDLFASEGQEGGGDYLVGAIMFPRTVEICLTPGGRIKGKVASDVEFQLFDNGAKQVVRSVTYSGMAEYPKFREDADLGMLLADSFADAAKKFAADPEVVSRAP